MAKGNRDLFAHEREMIDRTMEALRNDATSSAALHDACTRLMKSYGDLLTRTEKIFRISDMTSAEIKRTEARLKALLDNSNQGFLTVDSRLRVDKEYSSECDHIFGKTISGLMLGDLLDEQPESREMELGSRLARLFNIGSPEERQAEAAKLPRLLTINGMSVSVEYKFITSVFDIDETSLMLILTDVTEKRKAEERIQYLSYCDSLTGFYNRAYAEGRLAEIIRQDCFPIGLIMCDIDGLKIVNDLFGHRAGDNLIRAVAEVLRASSRKEDTIARWGGDEFLILLASTDESQCDAICRRIEENCRAQTAFQFNVCVSSGYSTIDRRETTFEDAFVRADEMMYEAKQKRYSLKAESGSVDPRRSLRYHLVERLRPDGQPHSNSVRESPCQQE